MIAPLNLPSENKRLEVINSLSFLSEQADKQLEDIASITARFCEVPIVLVSIVKKDTQEFFVNHGLAGQSTSREVSFCGHAILQDEVFVVEDAHPDERFSDNPLVTGEPNISFYAGYPIRVKGQKIGTLCMIDQKPRVLNDLQAEFHEVMARQVEQILNQKAFMQSYLDILHQFEYGSLALEENFTRFRDIISAISHDAIAPVRSIKSLVDLSKEDGSINLADFAEEMDKSLSSSEVLLTNLLKWGVDLADQQKQNKEVLNIVEMLENISYELRPELERKKNTLRFKGETFAWKTDSNKLRFILRNLIKNSNKFTSEGSIEFTWALKDGNIHMELRDNGIGMDAEQLASINSREEVKPGEGTSGEKGFGIGLKLIRSFTRSLEGDFQVESEKGKGTLCRLVFPIK